MAAPGEVCGLSTTRLRNPPSRDGRFSSELRFMLLSGGPLWRAPRFQIHKGAHAFRTHVRFLGSKFRR